MTFPVAGPLRTWLLALLALWALLLFGGFIFGQPDAAQSQRIPTWMRMASSAVLVVAAWSWWLAGVQDKGMALLIAVGMSLGFLGDLFMAGLLPASPRVLWGMGAFGLGHVAYIAAFMRLANVLGLTANGPRLAAWLAWLLIGAVGWYLVVFRGQQATALHWAALPYALLLVFVAVALSLFVGQRMARKTGVEVEPVLWKTLLVGVVVARLAFVWEFRSALSLIHI